MSKKSQTKTTEVDKKEKIDQTVKNKENELNTSTKETIQNNETKENDLNVNVKENVQNNETVIQTITQHTKPEVTKIGYLHF